MLNLSNKLYVYHDDNEVFTDYSNYAQDYARDDFTILLNKDEDYLYVGFRKPINAVFVEMKTANTTANSLTLQYYTTTWTTISTFNDETKGLTRSGFISWERNLTDEDNVTVNSQDAYWYRLRPSATHSAGTKIQGLNIIFADDNDLQTKVANISSYLASGATSHILSHVAARDLIIQDLRNSGKIILDTSTGRFKNLNVFDILDIGQLKEAAAWKALSLIFDDVSDRPEDKYDQRAKKYNANYKGLMSNIQFLGIDVDDDGVADLNEEQASATMTIFRR